MVLVTLASAVCLDSLLYSLVGGDFNMARVILTVPVQQQGFDTCNSMSGKSGLGVREDLAGHANATAGEASDRAYAEAYSSGSAPVNDVAQRARDASDLAQEASDWDYGLALDYRLISG